MTLDIRESAGRVPCRGTPFSCPSSSKCMPTTSDNSTVVCCPNGNDCSQLNPITCDIQQQNALLFPDSAVFTTDLDAILPKCDSGQCCPKGYTCSEQKCFLAKSPSSVSGNDNGSTGSPSSATSVPSSITNPSAKNTSNSTPNSTATTTPVSSPSITSPGAQTAQASSSHSTRFPPAAVVLGLALGLAFAIIITLLGFFCLRRRRRRRRQQEPPPSPDFMGKTPPMINSPTTAMVPSRFMNAPASAVTRVGEPNSATAANGARGTDFPLQGDVKSPREQQPGSPREAQRDSAGNLRTRLERATSITLQRCRSKRVNNPAPPARLTLSSQQSTPNARESVTPRAPLFDGPHRFGVPITPTPGARSRPQPERPPRSDEYVRTMSTHERARSSPSPHRPVPPPSRSPYPTVQQQQQQQHHLHHQQQPHYLNPGGDQHQQTLFRSNTALTSNTTTSTIYTDGSSGTRRNGASSDYSDREVMTVHLDTPDTARPWLPPPFPPPSHPPPTPLRMSPESYHDASQYQTHIPVREFKQPQTPHRPPTTFVDLMTRAGWKETDGWPDDANNNNNYFTTTRFGR